tara:strand:- start:26337 stop:28925 length:2589 start_codon:yes stop_codon:yes gene_type:complete
VRINSVRILLGLLLLLPTLAHGVPQCSAIFTNPATGINNPGMLPSTGLPSKQGTFICQKQGKSTFCNRNDNFNPGDYNFTNGDFDKGSYIDTNGATTRLYFDDLYMKNSDLNDYGKAEDLLVFVRGNLYLSGHNSIKGILYVEGSISMSGNATINGAVAVSGGVPSGGNFTANIDLSLLNKADFGGMCGGAPSGPDHYRLSFSSQALSCKAQKISLQACSNSSCSSPFASATSVDLTKNAAVYGSQSFTGSTSVDVWHGVGGTVTLGLSNQSPVATNSYRCYIDGNLVTDNANCKLTYAESGFIFDVPDKLANKPTGNISISAVKTSDETLQCVPLFSKITKNVDFWSSYINPITPISGQAITVNNTVMSKLESAATTLALAFDDTGKANIDVNYPDAGKMQLDAKYTGTGDEQGLVMVGSDQFVSFPVGLCVMPEDNNAKCSAGDSSCNRYKKAGESFNVVVQGKAWESDVDTDYCDNINTPNYGHNEVTLGHQLIAPSGGVLGEVGAEKYNHVAQTTNSNTVSQSVTEVGVFKFTADPASTYLGSSFYDIPLAASPNIGRFVPDRFVVSSSSVLPSCGSFTYMDQPFGLTLTLSAFNTGTYTTQNYQGAFAKAGASLVGENANDGVDLSGRLSVLPIDASSWALGEANVGLSYQANFSRTAPPSADGPFSQLAIGVQVFDNDGVVSFIASPDMRADSSDICVDSNNCNAKQLSTQDLRHGRVVMDNTYGPENEILRMPTYAQYWNGSDWITNIDDSCTHVSDALDGTEIYAPSLTAGQTVTRSDGGSLVSGGQLILLWQNSGSVAYRGQVTAPLQVDGWLKWYWNWDQVSPTQLYEPRASAFLGRYRGHDRIIYWREVGQ